MPITWVAVLLGATGQSENSTGPSGPLVDRPEHWNPLVIGIVQKASIKIVSHLSPRSQKGYMSLSLFGPLSLNLLLALTRTQHKRKKVKFTFNVAKCDNIFDELFKHGNIKLSHTNSLVEELKGHVYCKCHGSFLHNTNDCVVFRWQIQSTINEGR
jgi:hypothetical protein